MEFRFDSVNQIFPSGVAAMPSGVRLQGLQVFRSSPNSENTPSVVSRPIPNGNPDGSVNHNAPSAPATISDGWENWVGTANSVTFPCESMRPIWLTLNSDSVNHMLPSDPRTISRGWLLSVGIRKDLNVGPAISGARITAPSRAPFSANLLNIFCMLISKIV